MPLFRKKTTLILMKMNAENLNRKSNGISLNEAIEDFIFHCKFEKNLNTKTLKAYHTDLNQFAQYIEPDIKSTKIEDITKCVLKTYLQIISHFKTKTIKRKVASLKAMFNFLE